MRTFKQPKATHQTTSARSTIAGRVGGEIQTKPAQASDTGQIEAPSIVHEGVRSPGQPLDQATRAFMEERFGYDFSRVRVHSDAAAERSAQDLNAHAYTVGSSIVMGPGRFAPGTNEGRRLLAHELTHVVQADSAARPTALRPNSVETLEQEARQVARAVGGTDPLPPIQGSARGLAAPLFEGPDDPERPTFGNLPRDLPDPKGVQRRVQLVQQDGVWYEQRGGQRFRAEGSYDFVVQGGKIWAVKGSRRIGALNPGHTEAAAGGRVEYAGGVRFGTGKTTRGVVQDWSNASGHYAPVGFRKFAEAAGLPMDRFKPVAGGFPEKGPQLPVQQPRTRPRGDGPPKVPPGPPRLEELEADLGRAKKDKPAEPPSATKPTEPPAAAKTVAAPGADKPAPPPAKEPPTVRKPAEPPTVKKPTVPPTTVKPSSSQGQVETSGQTGGGGGKVLSTAASAAQRTYGSMASRYSSQLFRVASANAKDKEMADAIADMNKLLDAQAFLQNPKQFSAQYIAGYMVNGAFGKLSRQLAAAEARFFSTYPDVPRFHEMPLGNGMTLNALQRRYDETARNLRLPSARKTLITVFMMLNVTENTPKAEIDLRIGMINQYLASQPQIGKYIKEYNEAKVNYAFGLAMIRSKIDNLYHMLEELPAGFADDIRRRGDALYDAAKILEKFYNEVYLLSALPGGSTALYLLMTLSEGFAGLGAGLHQFPYRAGARKAEYKREILRLETQADHLSRLRGAFDVIYPR